LLYSTVSVSAILFGHACVMRHGAMWMCFDRLID